MTTLDPADVPRLNDVIRTLPVEGGRIELPPGEFEIVPPTPLPGVPPAAVMVDRPVEILGAGPAFGTGSATVLRVPRGIAHGFELLGNLAHRDGRAAHAAGARRSRLSGFALAPKARAGRADTSEPYTFGITIRAGSVELSNLHVQDAVEHNIQIISEGITVAGETFVDVADHWFMHHIRTQGAGLDGIYINGADAHIGTALQIDAVNNGRWGINDSSSFGNTHIGHHTRGNGYNPNLEFAVTIREIVGRELTIDHSRRGPDGTFWDPNPKDSTGWWECARLHERDHPGSHLRDENIPGPMVKSVIFLDPDNQVTRVEVDSLDLFSPTPRPDGSFERIGELRVGEERAFNAKYGGGYYSYSMSTYGTWIGCYAEVDQSFLLACREDREGDARYVRGQALVLGGGVAGQTNALQVIGYSRSKFHEKALATVKSADIMAAHLTASPFYRPTIESSGPWGDAEGSPRKILTSSEADRDWRAVRQFKYNAKYFRDGEYRDRRAWYLLEPYRGFWRAWEWLENAWFLIRRHKDPARPYEVPYAFTDEDHPHGPSHPLQGWSRVSSPFRFCLTKRFAIAARGEWEQLTVADAYFRDILPRRPPSGDRPPRPELVYPGTLALSLTVKSPSGSRPVELGSYELDGTTGTLRVWVRTAEPVPTGPADLPYSLMVVGERYQVSLETRASTTGALPAFFNASDSVLSAAVPGRLPAQDGVTLAFGDSLLVKDEPAPQHNGIYVLTGEGDARTPWKLQRRGDFNEAREVKSGAVVAVFEGATNGASQWVLTAPGTIAVGSTALTFWRAA